MTGQGWEEWRPWMRITMWAHSVEEFDLIARQQMRFHVRLRFGTEAVGDDYRFQMRGYREGACETHPVDWA